MAKDSVQLAALGDSTRRRIFELVGARPRTVVEITRELTVSQSAVSQHLKVLRDAGIVVETRSGVRHYFALEAAALDQLRRPFERLWQDVLSRFADYVKEAERARKRK